MKENKIKKSILLPMAALVVIAGIGGGALSYANISKADTSTTSAAVTAATGTSPVDPIDTPDAADGTDIKSMHRGHAPMGNDGNVTAINGTTISMQEENNEAGASYTIDASKATFSKDGVAGTISNIAIGDKIFVKGTVSGTNVSATEVSTGNHGHHDGPETGPEGADDK